MNPLDSPAPETWARRLLQERHALGGGACQGHRVLARVHRI
jgi:hypothetical protein